MHIILWNTNTNPWQPVLIENRRSTSWALQNVFSITIYDHAFINHESKPISLSDSPKHTTYSHVLTEGSHSPASHHSHTYSLGGAGGGGGAGCGGGGAGGGAGGGDEDEGDVTMVMMMMMMMMMMRGGGGFCTTKW